MTDDFKKTLFKYLTGNLENESGTEDEIFKEVNQISRDNWVDFIPETWDNFKYEGLIQVLNSELVVLYGGYIETDTQKVKGIITILDNNFNPIKTFYNFNSGTELRYIQCMYQNEDGSFIAIDCPDFPANEDWSFTTSQKRVIMLNNFTQILTETSDYILNLQKSYIIPNSNFYCKQIFKDPNSSHYTLIGNYLRDQNSPDFDGVLIIDLKINVGSENEWRSQADNGQGWFLGPGFVNFENDRTIVKVILCRNVSDNKIVSKWTVTFEDTITPVLTDIFNVDYHTVIDVVHYQNQGVFINENEVYFVLNNQQWGRNGVNTSKYISLYYYNFSTNENKKIYEKNLGEYDYCNLEAIYLFKNNGELYLQFNNNIDSDNNTADYYFQRLKDDDWNPKLIGEGLNFIYNQRSIFVKSNYNLVSANLYAINPRWETWCFYEIKENYNVAKYNGIPYINQNALIADNAEVYSNNSLVFARNLYNFSINENTSIATIEIPNNFLNNIDLTSKNLLSKTNLTLVSDKDTFRKNIYETVFLNFINSLQVLDKNNDNQVLNQVAASFINSKISSEDNYENTKMYSKIKIYYLNGETAEVSYEIENIDETSANISFSIYVDNLIDRAEILSNDKTTVYQTIDLSSLEINRLYSIKQKVEVI